MNCIYIINNFDIFIIMEIRQATCLDIKDIKQINMDSLPVYYNHKEYINFILDNDTFVLVSMQDSTITGYIIAKMYTKRRLHIITFSVSEKYRRQGVGSELIKESIKIAKKKYKVKKVTLFVKKSYILAINFYEKNEFIKKELLRHYYGQGDDGYYMVKILKK